MTDPGPFLNVDGDEFYMPAALWRWNVAQSEAAMMARDAEPLATSVYRGKLAVPLHEHDEPWGGDDDVCEAVLCYVFAVSDS